MRFSLAVTFFILTFSAFAQAEEFAEEDKVGYCRDYPEVCRSYVEELNAVCEESESQACTDKKAAWAEKMKEACTANPDDCQRWRADVVKDKRAKLAAWCKENPEKCAERREALKEKMDDWCAANPEKCEQMKERRRAQFDKWCEANPEKCAEMKAKAAARKE